LGRAALAVIVIALIQSGLGAAVRGEVQLIAGEGQLPRELWLTGVGTVDLLHRNLAVVTGAAVLGLAWWIFARVERDRWLRGLAVLALAMVFAQAGAGIGMATRAFPPWMQVAHLWLGSLMLGVLTLIALLAYRLDPRDATNRSQDQRSWSMRSASSSAAA
jgi:heme A synthase